VIIWHMLATGQAYTDLGADFYARHADPERETQRLLARLEAVGHKVTLAPPPDQRTRLRRVLPRRWLGPVSY
jgi:hypothetical protein